MIKSNLSELTKLIEKKKKVLIVSHYSPDGDALGSSFALYNFLKSINIDSYVYNQDPVPEYLSFLSINDFTNTIDLLPKDLDLVIVLDLNDLERAGKDMMAYIKNEFIQKDKDLIVIDHHENNKIDYGNSFIDTNACSTGVILYRLIKQFNAEISPEIATCLMTTIITDTSSYKNSNSNAESFSSSAGLVELGADLNLINENIFKLGEIKKLKLRNMIYSTLLVDEEAKLGLCVAEHSFYKETKTSKEDSEGIANSLIFYNGIEIGAFIREIDKDEWKISLRTNNFIDLSVFANSFGGGGHKNASGFIYKGKINNLIDEILMKLRNE